MRLSWQPSAMYGSGGPMGGGREYTQRIFAACQRKYLEFDKRWVKSYTLKGLCEWKMEGSITTGRLSWADWSRKRM